MGIYRGLGVVNDGLVFGYDTGYPISDNAVTNRFNQGQPATNLFTVLGTASSSDQNVTFAVNGTGTFKRVAVGTVIGDYIVNDVDVVYSYALGVNGCHYHGNDVSNIQSGSKVSLDIEYFLSPDVGSISTNYLGNFEILPGVSGSWGSVNTQKGVWHRTSLTRTATSTATLRMLMYPGACGGGRLSDTGTIYYKNPTVTLTDQPVPFVNGTRSDTASLIDLKRTASIDVGDVSFDSNAQPEFDGTDDIISQSRIIDTADYSAEFVFKADVNTSGTEHWLGSQYPGTGRIIFDLWTNNKLRNFINGTSITGATTIATGNWYHAIFTRNSSGVAHIYLNGVQDATGSISTSTPVNDPSWCVW